MAVSFATSWSQVAQACGLDSMCNVLHADLDSNDTTVVIPWQIEAATFNTKKCCAHMFISFATSCSQGSQVCGLDSMYDIEHDGLDITDTTVVIPWQRLSAAISRVALIPVSLPLASLERTGAEEQRRQQWSQQIRSSG